MENWNNDIPTFARREVVRRDERDFGVENALAAYVRRRGMTLKQIAQEFDLTIAQARGVLYAQASRATIRKVLQKGGWPLGLQVLTGVIGHDLETHLQIEKQRLANERQTFAERERRLSEKARNLRLVAGL